MASIAKVTSDFYTDPVPVLLNAIVGAEGGRPAFIRAIRCSFPACAGYYEAMARAAKTVRSRVIAYPEFFDCRVHPLFTLITLNCADPWTGEDHPRRLTFSDQFIQFLGAKWAPVGVDNDPHNLNQNWVGNVTAIYHKLTQVVT